MIEELSFDIRGMRYCAKAWGAKDAEPVLAIHGWLDNAASFDRLAPLMDQFRIIAVDLAGHGISDHYPPQAGYNIWDDLPEILLLLDELGWDKCHLLGHSRGATVCLMLAATYPERVQSLSLMDGLMPLRFVDQDPSLQLRTFLQDRIKRIHATVPTYATIEEAVNARVAKHEQMTAEVVRPIVTRGLKKIGEVWTWSNDPGVLGASAFKLGDREKQSLLKAVQSPGLLLVAENGFARIEEVHEQCALCPSIRSKTLSGHHHFHLDEQANDIAVCFTEHIQQHPLS